MNSSFCYFKNIFVQSELTAVPEILVSVKYIFVIFP